MDNKAVFTMALALACGLLAGSDSGVIASVFDALRRTSGLGEGAISFVSSAGFAGSLASAVVGGALARRIGHCALLGSAAIMYPVGAAVLASAIPFP